MNKFMLAFLIVMAVLTTGCPRDYYELTLMPRGDIIERTLVFYRSDDSNSSANAPQYQKFNAEELTSITSFYPKTGVTHDENRHTVKGEFAHDLPGDIGGAGWYTNLSTSLGNAGFYVERFRGGDETAATIEQRLQATDQLVDLIIGWSNVHFGSEPGHKRLHQFLDQDFRHDLKNLSMIIWTGKYFSSNHSYMEFLIRCGQYLIERGYMTNEESPGFIRGWLSADDDRFGRFIERFFARRLGITEEQMVPQSLIFLRDPEEAKNSWENYLAGTDFYQNRLRIWEEKKISDPQAEKPDPIEVVEELIEIAMDMEIPSNQNHLTVRLPLSSKPLRTNGEWDEENKQVVWESELAERGDTSRLPVFCYADWVAPREDFQNNHFGSVLLTGETLINYCLWRTSLEEKKALEWDQFIASLQPGDDAVNQLNNFRFSGDPELINDNRQKLDPDIRKELIKALQSKQ